jgi:hypothetical protein
MPGPQHLLATDGPLEPNLLPHIGATVTVQREIPKGKFDGVKTLPAFDVAANATGGGPRKQKAARSVAWGKCPGCTSASTGLIPSGEHLAWRLHWIVTHGGTSLPCRTSGTHLCAVPAKARGSIEAPVCRCQKAKAKAVVAES